MGIYIWLLPAVAGLFFMATLVYLRTKSKGLNRQIDKLNRRKEKFIAGLPKPPSISTSSELPTLPAAKANRRVVLDARTKQHEARQRRLVEHLKDLQAKESE
ncbi:MAG: hypothetical protein RLZ53_691 [Actinomycetota bacterium]|jgi:hypothetical protein